MKRSFILVCCIFLALLVCACSNKSDDLKEPVRFYYANSEISYNSPSGVVKSEYREGAGFHGNLQAFLHAYLRGPVSEDMESIIPSDVYLVSCEIHGDTVNIVLSSQFSKLSGIDLTTACSALLMTVHDYTGANTLSIQAKGEKLEEKDSIEISLNNLVLIDSVEISN